MSKPELPINANICEIDGPYYPVRLEWLPRKGDLIDLYSFLDTEKKKYEVVQVVHKLYDISKEIAQSHKGHHFVDVHVRPSTSAFFTAGEGAGSKYDPSGN